MRKEAKTHFELEKRLVNRHMSIETAKIWGAGFIFLVGVVLIVLNMNGFNVNQTVIMAVFGAAGFLASSTKIKSLKEIISHE